MYKIGPYQSIRHIAEAGLLECPFKCSLCGTCMYHNFCSYVTTAFTEARRLSEIDPTVKSIIDEAYKKRDKEVKPILLNLELSLFEALPKGLNRNAYINDAVRARMKKDGYI